MLLKLQLSVKLNHVICNRALTYLLWFVALSAVKMAVVEVTVAVGAVEEEVVVILVEESKIHSYIEI